jgi:nitric oxide reductase NorQ protein
MRYVPTHPRIVRGASVHQTMEEEFKEKGDREEKSEVSVESVEAKFLVPVVEHFVETEQVRRLKNRVKLWLEAGYPPHIVGPTGCGKTTMAMQVAKELKTPTVWINGDELVTTTDLIGGYTETEVESLRDRYIHNVIVSKDRTVWKWIDNPLTLACRHGWTLVYNEFSRTKPEANNVLLSVLEEGILELPTKIGRERYVETHPDFNIIFTSNSTEYAGVHKPQDALLDRMVDIFMDYYDFDTEVKIVQAHTDISKPEAERVVRIVGALRKALPEADKPGTRAEIMICRGLNTLDKYSEEDFDQICMDVLASKIGGLQSFRDQCALVKKIIDVE